jgi:hypothetical protein
VTLYRKRGSGIVSRELKKLYNAHVSKNEENCFNCKYAKYDISTSGVHYYCSHNKWGYAPTAWKWVCNLFKEKGTGKN